MTADEELFATVKESYLEGQAMSVQLPSRALLYLNISDPFRKRFAHPGEIATAIFYLNSDEASFCTGTEMRIDAGWGAK